jgi:hypothetical protein
MQPPGGEEPDPGQLRAHASHLDVLWARLGHIRTATEQIGRDQAAFGPLCGWIFTGMGDRHVRHDELVAYVQENLSLAAEGLRRAAAGDGELAGLAPDAADDATGVDPPMERESASGIVQRVVEAIRGREWVATLLADAVPVAEFAAPVTESVAASRRVGLDWALANVAPLRQMMDDLAGMPEVVRGHAIAWNAMAADLHAIAADLRGHLDGDLPSQGRADVRAYRALMSHNVEAITGIAATATAIAVITKAGGDMILLVRDIVRGLLADLIVQLIAAAPPAPGTNALRAIAWQLCAVVAAMWRIQAYVGALVTSMINLSQYIDG